MYLELENEVDRLFGEIPGQSGQICRNPVTDGHWVKDIDPIEPQKAAALRALKARERFARMGPNDAPPLPLSYGAREALKRSGDRFLYIVALFARSLEARNYDLDAHPSFEEYARGLLASPYTPDFIKNEERLQKRFPAAPLDGLGAGAYWEPPKLPRW